MQSTINKMVGVASTSNVKQHIFLISFNSYLPLPPVLSVTLHKATNILMPIPQMRDNIPKSAAHQNLTSLRPCNTFLT